MTNLANVGCFGGLTGSATISVSGGTGPFTYLWSNGGTSDSVSGLAAGSYAVSVTSANGCLAVVNVGIGQSSGIQITASATAVTQVGAVDGTVSLTVTGGAGGYT